MTFFHEPIPHQTVLARNNDGEFAFLETPVIIDRRTGLRGHGGRRRSGA